MALSRPPLFEPGGGVISVKTPRLMPASPFQNSSNRISASQVTPNRAAPTQSTRMMTSLRRRCASIGLIRSLLSVVAAIVLLPRLLLEPHQHQPRRRQHEEREDEQQQSEQNQA